MLSRWVIWAYFNEAHGARPWKQCADAALVFGTEQQSHNCTCIYHPLLFYFITTLQSRFQETEKRKATRAWIFQKPPLTNWEIVGYEKAKVLGTLHQFHGTQDTHPSKSFIWDWKGVKQISRSYTGSQQTAKLCVNLWCLGVGKS